MKKTFYLSILSLAFVVGYSLSARAQEKSPAPASPQAGAPTAEATENATATNDQALRTQIESQLAKDSGFQDLTVDVNHGVATLKGRVASRADRDRAKNLVNRIRGVAEVKDFIQIGGASSSAGSANGSNSASQAAASNNAGASSTTLANTSSTQSNATGQAAQNASASGSNQNEAKGANPESNGSTMPATTPSAAGGNISGLPQSDIETGGGTQGDALQSEIENAYSKEPMLANSNVVVKVTASEIDLSGKAENAKQKETARRIAQSYANNRRVVDKITVNTNPPAQAPQQQE